MVKKPMPFELIVPGFIINSLREIGESSNIDLKYAEFGFDSDSFFKGIEKGPKSPKEKNQVYFKAIDSKFSNEDPSLDPVAAQVIVDENAINRYITQMIMIDQIFSLR